MEYDCYSRMSLVSGSRTVFACHSVHTICAAAAENREVIPGFTLGEYALFKMLGVGVGGDGIEPSVDLLSGGEGLKCGLAVGTESWRR